MNIKSIGNKIKGNPKMVEGTVYSMLIICSISHFLNDMIQSIIPSIYPIVKDKFDFSFAQIGIIRHWQLIGRVARRQAFCLPYQT